MAIRWLSDLGGTIRPALGIGQRTGRALLSSALIAGLGIQTYRLPDLTPSGSLTGTIAALEIDQSFRGLNKFLPAGQVSAAPPAGTRIHIIGANAANARVAITSYGTASVSGYSLQTARGTAAAPTATQINDTIGVVDCGGYGATGFAATSRASVRFQANQTWTDAAQGARIEWATTADGAIVETARMRLGGTTANPSGILQITDNIAGTAMSLPTAVQNLVLNVYVRSSSNNDHATGVFRCERTGNSGARIGAWGRSYDIGAVASGAKSHGLLGTTGYQSRGTAQNAQGCGVYGSCEIGTGQPSFSNSVADPNLITGKNFMAGVAGVSFAAGTTDSVNCGLYGNAGNAALNFSVYGQGVARFSNNLLMGTVTPSSNTVLQIYGADGAGASQIIATFSNNAGDSPAINAYRARGTITTPLAIADGDKIFSNGLAGFNGTAWTATTAEMRAIASGAWTATAQGTSWEWTATPSGTVTNRSVLRVSCDGSVTPSFATLVNNGTNSIDFQLRTAAANASIGLAANGSIIFGRNCKTFTATGDGGLYTLVVGSDNSVYGSTSALYSTSVFGQGNTVTDLNAGIVCIGNGITWTGISGAAGRSVLLGNDISGTATIGGKTIVIGTAIGTGSAASGMVIIGADRTGIDGNNGIVIVRGGAATINAQTTILIGSASGQVGNFGKTNCIAIGFNVTANAARAMAIGDGAACSFDNSCAFGRSAICTAINQFILGSTGFPLRFVNSFAAVEALYFNGMADVAVTASQAIGKAMTRWTGAGGATLTLPVSVTGDIRWVRNSGSAAVSVVSVTGGTTVAGGATYSLAVGASVMLVLHGTDWVIYSDGGISGGGGGGTISGTAAAGKISFGDGVNSISSDSRFNFSAASGWASFRKSGTTNESFGELSFNALTTGNDNTAIGYGALYSLATGNNNTGLGVGALTYTTGSRNTGLGYIAGSGITAGSDNVAVGHQAGAQSNGSRNLMIGGNADGGPVTVNDCVLIGYGATMSAAGTNRIAIGSLASANADNQIMIGGSTGSGFAIVQVVFNEAAYEYFGDPGVDGTWRVGRSGVNLITQLRVSGVYVTKQTIIP